MHASAPLGHALRLALALAVAATTAAPPDAAYAGSSTLVISQVYGGGGNSGATYKNDFIEIMNRGTTTVDLTGWSVQYAAAASAIWAVTPLAGSIPPGGYYLVQEAQGAGGTTNLPTPDATGTISMNATAAKVALSSSTVALTGTCPSGGARVDMVGYGATASCFEGAPMSGLSNTNAGIRANAGCADTDDNATDFSAGAPTPRNSASAAHPCLFQLTVVSAPPAGGAVARSPDQTGYDPGSVVQLTPQPSTGWHFVNWGGDAGGSDVPLSLVMDSDKSVTANFALDTHTLVVSTTGAGAVSATPNQPSYDFGTVVRLTASPAPGSYFVGWGGDASGRANPLDVTMDADKSITATFAVNTIVISQVYGGGGNAGATYTNDFIELFNRGASAIDVGGWTVQYAPDAGGTWTATALAGTIPAGGYYLVQEAAGAGGSLTLPAPDATGTIAMNAVAGKVGLVDDPAALSGACPASPDIEDLVGYGGTASCAEGSPAPTLSNTTAAVRQGGGCQDTGDNAADFAEAPPAPRHGASPVHSCLHALSVVVDPVGVGSVAKAPDAPSYAHGSSVQLTASAISGYHFVRWSGDATGSANPLSVIMDADKSIIAHFAANTVSGSIVISQVYGGGGNNGSTYTNDFVELYNRGNAPVNVTGWTVQYGSAGGGPWFTTTLIGTIPAGRYYLVEESGGPNGTIALPSPDAIGTIGLAADAGKVALASDDVVLTGECPTGASIVDLLGYGAANCDETAAAPALDNVTAAFRNSGGCDESNDNSLDFSVGPAAPRNSATALHVCPIWLGADAAPITEVELDRPAPNPAFATSRVRFALPHEAVVRLRVIDLQGRVVATLADGTFPAGRHAETWDGATTAGRARPGMYYLRMDVANHRFIRSVLLVR